MKGTLLVAVAAVAASVAPVSNLAVAGPISVIELGCGAVALEHLGAGAGSALQRPATETINLLPHIKKLRASRPGDGEHRIFTTTSGMNISVELREGEITAYKFDREVKIEYHKRDMEEEPLPREEEGFHQGDCGSNEVPCDIRITHADGSQTIYFGCCPVIVLD